MSLSVELSLPGVGSATEAATVAGSAQEAGVAEQVLRGHAEFVEFVEFSPDGKWIATGSRDNRIILWGPESAKTLEEHRDRVTGVRFSPDGKRLASASYDGTVRVWDVPGGATRELDDGIEPVGPADQIAIKDLAWSPDGKALAAVGYDRKLRVWRGLRVRFCCAGCETDFLDDPRGYLAAIDLDLDELRAEATKAAGAKEDR